MTPTTECFPLSLPLQSGCDIKICVLTESFELKLSVVFQNILRDLHAVSVGQGFHRLVFIDSVQAR
jgi:hypothetical protein